MQDFVLDTQLEKDSYLLDCYDEIQIRTINDGRYIWFILVPAIPGIKDWQDLPEAIEAKLIYLTRRLSMSLSITQKPDKINVAAIGNIVSQFHLHIVVRYKNDASWPKPIWGYGEGGALTDETLKIRQTLISDFLLTLAD